MAEINYTLTAPKPSVPDGIVEFGALVSFIVITPLFIYGCVQLLLWL